MSDNIALEVVHPVIFNYTEDQKYAYCIPKGVHFSLNKIYSILGVSGSGKSTILTLLAALRRFRQGIIKYSFSDQSIKVTSENWKETVCPFFWGKIGFSFQKPELIRALTVKMNLEMALGKNSTEEMVLSLFEEKEWHNIKNSRIWKISGGQIQRIGIIRAFGKNQNLIFMDEPTNNLDKSNRENVVDFIQKYKENKAIVIVSHDEKFLNMLKIDETFEIYQQEVGKEKCRRILRPIVDKLEKSKEDENVISLQ